ncbi:MAG: Gfo/Idh/MocA family oxidoreductase [Lentisphaerae bacterium]|nr:Gfo/Idh/MocA family oxidoreductase [Lentisphaerota bacterium]
MKKVAFVGASMRAAAFVNVLKKHFSNDYTIAAVMDIDPGKMKGFLKIHSLDVPTYTDFDKMCAEIAPDMVIVSTIDVAHADYVIKCLDRKIACVSEKPLCISAGQCKAIKAAQERNPEVFAVTSHNARYTPITLKMKELITNGTIGKVMRMEYTEMLDRFHGKSYFQRWNSRRKNSNGLQLHKSCHHFDKMNFLLDSYATEVTSSGTLTAYGKDAPHKFRGENCHTCPHASECPDFKKYNAELFDSEMYTPDMCIYSPEIDIEDNYCAGIKFANGVFCTYSLCAHAQYEGEIIIVEGETGRLEARRVYFRERVINESNVHDDKLLWDTSLKLYRYRQSECEEIEVFEGEGGHGGADLGIFKEIFSIPPSPTVPKLEEGIQAVLTGCALVESMQTGRKCMVQEQMAE